MSITIGGPLCSICCEQYNDSTNIPLIVCPEIHTICSKCLEVLLKKPGDKLACPFDGSKSNKKILSEYKKNRGLLDSIQVAQGLSKVSGKKCFECPTKADATKLCLKCHQFQCDACISKNHKLPKHTRCKLGDVPRMLIEKKNFLNEALEELEASVSGEKRIVKLIESKENELKEQAHTLFEGYHKTLNKYEEIIMKGIKKELADISDKFATKNSQEQKKSQCKILEWINETKSLTHSENKGMMDNHRILCDLYKQQVLFENLDTSLFESQEDKEDRLVTQFLNRMIVQANAVFLENFNKYNPVKFEHKKNNSDLEEAKNDYSLGISAKKPRNDKSVNNSIKDFELEINDSNNESSNYQSEPPSNNKDLSPSHLQQDSEWITTGSKSEHDPVKEERNHLHKAFRDAKLEVQVEHIKDSNTIALSSLYDKHKLPTYGLKGDEELAKFHKTLCNQKLGPSLKRVTSLKLTSLGLKRNGAMNLSKALEKLSLLETLEVEFFNSGDLQHEDLDALMQVLGKSKNLSTLSLSCQKWKHLKDHNLSSMIEDLALLGKLKNLTLNFSGCHRLTTPGIMEAFHGFSDFASLEDLKISFNECEKVDEDETCLESIYQVYSEMAKLRKIEFEFVGCQGFTERGKKVLKGPLKSNDRLVVDVKI